MSPRFLDQAPEFDPTSHVGFPRVSSSRNKRPGFPSDMGRPAIDDQEDHALCSGEQAFQKFDDNRGVDAA
jgi:hypothetical protein